MAYTPPTPPRNFSIDEYKKKLGDPFNKVVGLKRQLGKSLGTPYLSGAEAKHHLVVKLKELSDKSFNKQQIIEKIKKEYGLKMDAAKAVGNYLIPENTGQSKADEEKQKKMKLRMKAISGVLDENRMAAKSGAGLAERRTGKADNLKKGMLAPHIHGVQTTAVRGAEEKPMGTLVVGPWGGGAENLTKKGDLEVQHIEGGTGFSGGKPAEGGFAGGKPQRGVASIAEARKKKSAEKPDDKPENTADLGHQNKLAA